jgi:hypothetical protein
MKNTLALLATVLCLCACNEVSSSPEARDNAVQTDTAGKSTEAVGADDLPHIPFDPDRPNYVPLPPGFFDQFSPELYEVRINEHVLRIPTNHLRGRPITKNIVGVFAFWPGMLPYSLERQEPAPYDGIDIFIEDAYMGRSSGKPADGHARAQWEKNLLPRTFNEELRLWDYRSPHRPDNPYYYVADINTLGFNGKRRDESVFITCAGMPREKNNNDARQCQVFYFVREDISVTYRFFHKHIASWHEINTSVRELVESFFVKDNMEE